MKVKLIVNSAIVCVFVSCVTIAAMHFGKPGILSWYLLTLLMLEMNNQNHGKDD